MFIIIIIFYLSIFTFKSGTEDVLKKSVATKLCPFINVYIR